jgi:3-hydroxyisobutyrate dehydrogenase
VAFLGLGVMGYPMAGHLALAGHRVTVYNRTAARALEWCDEFAATAAVRHARTPQEAGAGADIVFCCVGNDDDLRSVVLGRSTAGPSDRGWRVCGHEAGCHFAGPHNRLGPGGARAVCRRQSSLGLHFVDAPVSGGQAGAQNGMLTVMCGGDAAAFEPVQAGGTWRFPRRSRAWAKVVPASLQKW